MEMDAMDAHTSRRVVLVALLVALALTACGPGETGAAEEAADEPTTSADDGADPDDALEPADAPPSAAVDVSDVDWATVDLTTIDWANIDLSQVDFTAVERNPTARSLDDQTVALIRSRMNPGRAVLTVGDLTWEFDTFLCAFGHEATASDVYSFSSDSQGEHEGVRVQMQANIRDESGQGRFEGSGLEHEVFIQDIEDFEDPVIDLEMSAPDGIRIDGNSVTAEGMFRDMREPGAGEAIPGTLEATCSDASSR
jgi:hypothetical protein